MHGKHLTEKASQIQELESKRARAVSKACILADYYSKLGVRKSEAEATLADLKLAERLCKKKVDKHDEYLKKINAELAELRDE